MARARKPLTLADVRAVALALPGIEEGTSYGTPAFRVGKTLLARMHQDRESVVVKIELAARDARLAAEPEKFFVTDHYLRHPWILVRLATASRNDLRALLEEAHRSSAPPLRRRERALDSRACPARCCSSPSCFPSRATWPTRRPPPRA